MKHLTFPYALLGVRCLIGAAAVMMTLAAAHAQTTAVVPPAVAAAATAKTFALVSAVGDQFQYVRQKESVGDRKSVV